MEWPTWWNSISSDLEFAPISEIKPVYISTGILELDKTLQGGLHPGNLYEIVGEAGTGKTNLALEVLKNISNLHKGYYLSTQKPISESRLLSIQINPDNILTRHANSIDQITYHIFQEIPEILQRNEVKLIIIDNIYSIVQEVPSDDHKMKTGVFIRLAVVLKYLSMAYSVGLIIINNVVSDMKEKIVPGLGLNWANCTNHRIFLEKKNTERFLKILHSNSASPDIKFAMIITDTSVQLLQKL